MLATSGLLGKHLDKNIFLPGEQFFNHITFMGCAPNIPLTPEQGENHIKIQIITLNSPILLADENSPTPLCSGCGTRLLLWKKLIKRARSSQIRCDACHTHLAIQDINFRKRACYSQTAIGVGPVFESEAQPGEGLMNKLAETCNTRFSYAYINDNAARLHLNQQLTACKFSSYTLSH
jgi:hypothetical protein